LSNKPRSIGTRGEVIRHDRRTPLCRNYGGVRRLPLAVLIDVDGDDVRAAANDCSAASRAVGAKATRTAACASFLPE
jgi:hypothetical protein